MVKRLDQGFLGSQIQVGPVPLHQLVFFAAADPAGGYKGTRLLCFDQALTVINWEMQWSEGIKVVRGHQPLPLTLTLAPDPDPNPQP